MQFEEPGPVESDLSALIAPTEEIIDDFREFINNINPEDFGQ